MVGVAAAALSGLWLVRFHLSEPLTASDFLDYCAAVASLTDGHPEWWPLKRSRLPGLPTAWLRPRVGLVDALLLNAAAGTALMFAALHLWGSALAGRVGGLATVAVALTMSPLVLQARMLTFYPMVNAALALAAAGAAVAARTRSVAGLAFAGLGIGVALLADVRALIWALPCFGVALLVAVFAAGAARTRAARAVALVLPVAGSFLLGPAVYPAAAYPLEKQLDVRPLYALHGSQHPAVQPPYLYPSDYVWGRTPLADLPLTVGFLLEQSAFEPPDDVEFYAPQGLKVRQVAPWTDALGWTLPLALVLLVRRPWQLWAFAGAALPYAVALRGMADLVEIYPRFLTQGLPAVAIAGGVAVGVVWRWAPWQRLGRSGPVVSWALAAGLLALVVLGVAPTPLSPTAYWRAPWAPVLQELYEVGQALRSPTGGRPGDPETPCVQAITADRERLGVEWSALVPFSDSVRTDYSGELGAVPSSRLGDQPGNAPPSAPPAGAVNGP